MDIMSISSRQNPIIKLVCSLNSSKKARQENGLFVLEGLRLCEDAADNNIHFEKLILSSTAITKYKDTVLKLSAVADEIYSVSDELFARFSDTVSPQGVLAIAALPDSKDRELLRNGRYIALENTSDPANLGAIARTAEALGISGLILSKTGCDPYSPKALRASMGTLLRIPIFLFSDIPLILEASGLVTYACVVDENAQDISETGFLDGSIIVIGNEANGLTERAISACGRQITIPMKGKAESLNAAAAAAIAMWELIKKC